MLLLVVVVVLYCIKYRVLCVHICADAVVHLSARMCVCVCASLAIIIVYVLETRAAPHIYRNMRADRARKYSTTVRIYIGCMRD